jgi:hypothetical protein
MTEIAFDHLTVDTIIAHGTKRTDGDTGTTPDTDVMVNPYKIQLLIPGNGFNRADIQTGSIVTLSAGHRDIQPLSFPFHDPDAAARRV